MRLRYNAFQCLNSNLSNDFPPKHSDPSGILMTGQLEVSELQGHNI